MTPSRWRQIEGILNACLERAEGERASFLDQACAADDELRREVEALLLQQAQTNVMDQHVGPTEDEAEPTVTIIAAGLQIGVYRIAGKLGEGGMGAVYKALDTRLNRSVALKVLSDRFADAASSAKHRRRRPSTIRSY